MANGSKDFARAFGDALVAFLQEKGISEAQASHVMRIDRARLNTYTHDSPEGKRTTPSAEVLFRACSDLGFVFDYKGYQITAASLGNGNARSHAPPTATQLDFFRQFNLTEDNGQLSVRLKRQPDRVEMSVSLKAAS
jgi:transcriptional regulator with XRE-family HTH domain